MIFNEMRIFRYFVRCLFRSFGLLLVFYSFSTYAECKRDDVNFYLEKGFNHEQIVKLCSPKVVQQAQPMRQPPPGANNYPSAPRYPAGYQVRPRVNNSELPKAFAANSQPRPLSVPYFGDPDTVFLATAVEGYDVELSASALSFSRKECFDHGWQDWNGFQDRACPHVKYSISRGTLEVVERDNGLFGFGGTALYVSGDISVKILNLSAFEQEHHAEIQSKILQQKEKLKINVRSGMPQPKVEAILVKLAG